MVLAELSSRCLGATGSAFNCSSFGASTTTVIFVAVTPCAVAPPLLLPAFHALTHVGPPPISVLSKRPYGPYFGSSCRQRGLSSAAWVPIPDAATGGPAPSGRGIAAA